jgi:hypothetical protein
MRMSAGAPSYALMRWSEAKNRWSRRTRRLRQAARCGLPARRFRRFPWPGQKWRVVEPKTVYSENNGKRKATSRAGG